MNVNQIFRKVRALALLVPALTILPVQAGTPEEGTRNLFNHMDLGLSLSTTGIGADISMPAGDWVRLRAGFTYMPKFTLRSGFQVKFDEATLNDATIEQMMDMMHSFTGIRVDEYVDMDMQPTFGNFRFMVDVLPFKKNRHWHFTAGFYAGPSRAGIARNAREEGPSLMAVQIYNTLYQKFYRGESFQIGGHDVDVPPEVSDKVVSFGMLGMSLGRFADGDRAMMVPKPNSCIADARMDISRFRPYVGVGYSTTLSRNKRVSFTADMGVMTWGGKPHVYVDNVYKVNLSQNGYDMVRWDDETSSWMDVKPMRIDLIRDVSGIDGKVGDMVRVVRHFRCMPIVNLTFSYKLF